MVWPASVPSGRIHLIKMNILPHLLYYFQMLPIMLSKKVLAKFNSAIISFIWRKKRTRLRYCFLCLPIKNGGLAAPSLLYYLCGAQFKFLLEWFIGDPDSVWLRCESASLDKIPLLNLLYISPGRVATLVKDKVILKNMLKVSFTEKPFNTCSFRNTIAHSKLHMHAACENDLLPPLPALANERKYTEKQADLKEDFFVT